MAGTHRLTRPAPRIAGFVAAAVALTLGVSGSAAADVPKTVGSATASVAPIEFDQLRPCRESRPARIRCGRLRVPLERSDPALGTISIRFGVVPRKLADRPSKGAVLGIEGGPGYGSVDSAVDYDALFGGLLKRRDLLVVDMRGTGGSGAIDCPDLQRGIGPKGVALAACARQLGASYESYRTAAAADDIEAVREALGYGKLSVYGDSYGTYLAQSYAFRHPDSLDALILDSAYPVRGESGWYPSTWRTGIRSLAVACRRSEQCRPGARERLERFVGMLRRTEKGVGPLLTRIAWAGYSPPAGYVRINRAIAAYLDGRPARYERITRARLAGTGKPRIYSLGLELGLSCNDYPMIWDKEAGEAERRLQLEQAIAAYPEAAFEPFTPREVALTPDWGYLPCLNWPAPGPNWEPAAAPDAPAPDIPVLVVAGELDNVTSPKEATLAADLFPASELFVVRDSGHVYSLFDPTSPEAQRIRTFLRDAG